MRSGLKPEGIYDYASLRRTMNQYTGGVRQEISDIAHHGVIENRSIRGYVRPFIHNFVCIRQLSDRLSIFRAFISFGQARTGQPAGEGMRRH